MATLILGDDAGNTLIGASGDDVIYGFNPDGAQSQVSTIRAERVASGFVQPLFAGAPPGDLQRLFIVEKTGKIKIVDTASGQVAATPFLDVTTEISTAGEGGLLGLAFQPDFAASGVFFVNLTNASGDTEIRRYRVSGSNPNIADASSASLVIGVNQPDGLTNHKAGWLGFGPDGYLYAALGDGGSPGDALNSGQDVNSLLGKMLRLDVASDAFPSDPTRNYAIPSSNPFVATAGADEIWALGLRNPWRDSFDRATGTLYIADVGQSAWEEINIGAAGANYGWKIYEGPAPFSAGSPSAGTLTFPIHAYERTVGRSITGGYVYRGESEGLHGHYFFADFVLSKLFTLHFDGAAWNATDRTAQIVTTAGALGLPSSFGEDGRGDLYVVDWDGEIFRLSPLVASADQADHLDGGPGNDLLFGGSGDDVLIGAGDNDGLHGQNGADTLDGGAGNDIVIGGAGGDTLNGGEGSDVLAGDAGDDALEGGAGADRLDGGASSDDASYASATAGVVANLAGPVQNSGDALGDSYVAIEGLIGSPFNDALVGDDNANALQGGSGNDYLQARGGVDTLLGGAGVDRLEGGPGGDVIDGGEGFDYAGYYYAIGPVTVDLGMPANSLGEALGDSFVDIEGLFGSRHADVLYGDDKANDLAGAEANDQIFGRGGIDHLLGMDGDDTLEGGTGHDTLTGGAGFDFASYGASAGGVLANLAGAVQNSGEAFGDSYRTIEGLIGSAFDDTLVGDDNINELRGGGGNDYLQARAGADTLGGGNGDDRLEGGAQADALDGGDGTDYAAFHYAAGPVTVDLGNASANFGDAAGDSYLSIEGLIGSAHGDTLAGDGDANYILGLGGNDGIAGGAGADSLVGMDGDDALDGGAGADRLSGGAGNDTFTFTAGAANGDALVDFAGNAALAGDRLVFAGYGSAAQGASFIRLSATRWSINSADGAVSDVVTLVNAAPVDATDYAFV